MHKPNQDVNTDWESSSRGERAWKEATDKVAASNADARKAGRRERETYEREREEARRAAQAKQHAKLLKRPTP
jgi:hypothetical protein